VGARYPLLRATLEQCSAASETASTWGLILEFSIPRKELRIDVVLLVRETIVILEAKTEKPPHRQSSRSRSMRFCCITFTRVLTNAELFLSW